MSLTPASRLYPYEILAPLGAGGMGEVVSRMRSALGRRGRVEDFPDRVRRLCIPPPAFEAEARAATAPNHPNIVAVCDVGEETGTP
jgi:hypothetical protein